MTRGMVVVLGKCGRNFAAGMSGGIAYVLDEKGDFAEKRCNIAAVDLEAVPSEDIDLLYGLINSHVEATSSPRGKWVLENWENMLPKFIKVFPHEFKRVLGIARQQVAVA
jgi:glutamate synthase domain-containing protein 3